MFNTNNKEVINRIASRTLTANKTRNIFIVLAIALTTMLITSIFSIGISFVKSNELQKIRIMRTTAHAALTYPTHEQIEKIKTLDYVKTIGEQYYVASIINTPEMKNMSLTLHRFEENEWTNNRIEAITDFVGSIPQKYNEIMMPLWVLDTMGIEKPKIGMKIPLEYSQHDDYKNAIKQTFVLSGYFTDYLNIRSGNINSIFVSDEFAKASGNNITKNGSVTITFKDINKIIEYTEQLEKDIALSDGQQVKIVPMYDVSANADLAASIGFCTVIFIVLFSGYLLIYNILCISVAKDIRFYGLLKTIGTTPKQLKRIVRKQAIILSCIGIPIGLIIGALISFLIVPFSVSVTTIETGAEISFNPIIFIGAIFFALITTWISTIKPAKMASKITPVEAVRFTSKTIKKHNKKSTNGGKIHKMAYANIFRDKKLSAIVFTSLFLGLTIFIIINTLVFSMNTDNFIASYMENDFNLYNNTFGAINTNRFLKQKFDEKFIADVKQMEGVTELQTILLQGYELQYESGIYDKHIQAVHDMYNATSPSQEQLEAGGFLYGYIVGLDTKRIEELNKTLQNPIDAAAFLRGEIALISTNDPALYPSDMTIKGKAAESNQYFSFKLGGFVPWLYQVERGSVAPNIYISTEAFIKVVENPIVYKINIDSNAKFSPEILEKLKLMIKGDNDITMESKLEMQKLMESTKMMLYILGYGLSLILALIGILNFINVMFTSVTVRSVELAVLSSIGMTKKQLKNMLMLEGVGYFAISAFLIMVFGTGITFGVFKLFQQQATYAIFSYPIIPVLSALGVVFIVCIYTPLISFGINEKESVIERLRKAE